ncbi:MAG: P-II family nitrogen regulator [Turicibacter sp.]|nr:P-II family nitrogen regulator [Turicibacter sp.]
MTKIVIITSQAKFDELKPALDAIGITGMTVTHVIGYGLPTGEADFYRGLPLATNSALKVKIEIIVSELPVSLVVDTAKSILHTGKIGDGKIFIYDVENVIRIRTGEEGYDALQY